ncbi:SPOR domain-containing protein [Pseudomonas sp. L-22-4S-12]|uniref:SPOR domain-containing protein n=1 Tax=Pseudomonas sp. L-22-4S-12 TaxID=2610893 RepID=UPI0013276FAD|nr:SPOR domain-containing protein [Pseudomonas sp. L-22-4S-12]MWV18192.1 SPOR domain-containing protein [Pseudomonas sp. L-22-4S-12]
MAVLDKGLKQRIVGALVLVALAVIFLPMLFSREDELRQVVVDAPAMPQAPAIPEVALDPVEVPQPIAEEQVPPVEPLDVPEVAEAPPAAAPAAVALVEPSQPAAPAEPARLDASSLPVSWSVQLASLSSRSGAEELQKKLRSQGYNAYVRTFEGMNRVFVGPLVERAEADRLRDQLNRQQKLNGFVVRFQPESN